MTLDAHDRQRVIDWLLDPDVAKRSVELHENKQGWDWLCQRIIENPVALDSDERFNVAIGHCHGCTVASLAMLVNHPKEMGSAGTDLFELDLWLPFAELAEICVEAGLLPAGAYLQVLSATQSA